MWLEAVVNLLQTVESPKHQFIAAVCVASCSFQCHMHNLNQQGFVYPLLRMLRIQPSVEHRLCPNVSFLFDILSKDRR